MYHFSITEDGQGEIQIDSFRERFCIDFGFWSKADYYQHWQQASQALREGQSVSFVQSMYDGEPANFYRIWAAYPRNGEVVFQEQLLMLDDGFNMYRPHLNAQPYEFISEDGEPISEWRSQMNN